MRERSALGAAVLVGREGAGVRPGTRYLAHGDGVGAEGGAACKVRLCDHEPDGVAVLATRFDLGHALRKIPACADRRGGAEE